MSLDNNVNGAFPSTVSNTPFASRESERVTEGDVWYASTSSHPFVFFSSLLYFFHSLRSQSILTDRFIHSLSFISYVLRVALFGIHMVTAHTRGQHRTRGRALLLSLRSITHIVTLLFSSCCSSYTHGLQHVQKGHRRVLLIDIPVREHRSMFIF